MGQPKKCIASKCKGWTNVFVGSCCCNAVTSKVCDVDFAVKVVVLCYRALKNFWVFSSKGVYSVFVGLVTQLCSPSSVCVERGHMLCAHTKLTFRLHHARHSCSVFTALWSGCSVIKITFYLHQMPSWLWLVWTTSPVFTPIRYRSVGTNNARTPLYHGHASSPRIPGLYHIYPRYWPY